MRIQMQFQNESKLCAISKSTAAKGSGYSLGASRSFVQGRFLRTGKFLLAGRVLLATVGLFVAWSFGDVKCVDAEQPALSLAVQDEAVAEVTMQYPIDVAVDSKGIIYVADRNLPGIWKIVAGKAEVYFQADKKFRTPLNAVRCLAVDAQDRLLAGCSTTTEVYRFEDGKPNPLTGGKISVPMNLSVAQDGSIWVCDLKMRLLISISPIDGSVTEVAEIQAPKAVAMLSEDAMLVLTGVENPILSVVQAQEGQQKPEIKNYVSGRPFNFPADMVILQDKTIVVSDSYDKCLWKVSADGEASKWVTDDRFVNPVGLATANGTVFVADSRANAIFSVDSAGTVEVVFQAAK